MVWHLTTACSETRNLFLCLFKKGVLRNQIGTKPFLWLFKKRYSTKPNWYETNLVRNLSYGYSRKGVARNQISTKPRKKVSGLYPGEEPFFGFVGILYF